MKALRQFLSLAAAMLVLSGCALPVQQTAVSNTPNPNDVATQVNKMLTSIPGQTQLPTQAAQAQVTIIPTIPQLKPTTTTAPTIEKTATGTPAVTATLPASASLSATGTATTAATDPKASLGTPTRADQFDTTQFWGLFNDSHTIVASKTGFLTLTAVNPDGWHGWSLTSPKLTNFYLEVTGKSETCDGIDSYGPMFRAPDATHGYIFMISCDGRYRLEKWAGNSFTDLVPWTENSAILKGSNQTNRLGVMAKDNSYTLYVNGTQVGQASDSAYTQGAFGLAVAAFKTPNFTADIDEVDYWNLP